MARLDLEASSETVFLHEPLPVERSCLSALLCGLGEDADSVKNGADATWRSDTQGSVCIHEGQPILKGPHSWGPFSIRLGR
jgi:hypothetical protein